MKVQVWEEGYACTGQSGESYLAWEGEAVDFEDACQKLIAQRAAEPDRWGSIIYHRLDNGRHLWWGCGWFPTREQAGYFDR